MQVLMANPRGFCAGVVRAIETVENALDAHGAPVYVFHQIVHNGHVVAGLQQRGAVFVDDIECIPSGALTIFSAHGVSRSISARARERGLSVIDATCPLVAKVHLQAQRYARQGRTLVMIGHAGHEEVDGTLGAVDVPVHLVTTPADAERLPLPGNTLLAYVTQTTLSVDDTREVIAVLERRFPALVGPALSDICYATQNRQQAVRLVAAQVDLLLVVGAHNSSNSRRLREVGAQRGVPAYLVAHAGEVDAAWLVGVERVGLSAGASTPESLVQGVCDRLRELGARSIRQLDGLAERVSFGLPPEAKAPATAADSFAVGAKAEWLDASVFTSKLFDGAAAAASAVA